MLKNELDQISQCIDYYGSVNSLLSASFNRNNCIKLGKKKVTII